MKSRIYQQKRGINIGDDNNALVKYNFKTLTSKFQIVG